MDIDPFHKRSPHKGRYRLVYSVSIPFREGPPADGRPALSRGRRPSHFVPIDRPDFPDREALFRLLCPHHTLMQPEENITPGNVQ